MSPRLWFKHCSSMLDLAMLAIRSSEEESPEMEEMDTSESNWCWFYLAECGVWHMFEIDPSAACSVTSAQIEQCYNRNQRGIMEFYTAKYTYRLDFSVMRQINVTTGKQRPIKRSLHSATGFRFICDNLALPVPCHWERINTDEPYQLIQLGRDTYEFKEVARLYERTMDHPIKSIQRIQNLDLWEFFCRKKTQLRKVKRTLDIEERMLFHGTGHSNIQAICTFNFDWRLTGSHGDVYGKGSYFARDAKYSIGATPGGSIKVPLEQLKKQNLLNKEHCSTHISLSLNHLLILARYMWNSRNKSHSCSF
ncbi:protein mono-ADP-ribosyltransferase PARP11 isoform X2 [Oryzias melastigma]|uniref:protein mono-ADP-ribosyltransferase PARP11 isoform X2 n=1 Tax=Oryzias melastigma TaxID=30732 RepID=UPI00168D6FE3|nr:protein mono-ADP-ribosyltransferase PARP11 isoform X2 [Oryzias melastigma]